MNGFYGIQVLKQIIFEKIFIQNKYYSLTEIFRHYVTIWVNGNENRKGKCVRTFFFLFFVIFLNCGKKQPLARKSW